MVSILRWPAWRFDTAAAFLRDDCDPARAAAIARHFSRTCVFFPLHAWRYRTRTIGTARGLATLLAATGRYDDVARLLGNPFVFMLVRPGDGRWLEVLKSTIDHCEPGRSGRLGLLFRLVRSRSPLAAALWRRTRGEGATAAEFKAVAEDRGLPPTALPYVLETLARRLPVPSSGSKP